MTPPKVGPNAFARCGSQPKDNAPRVAQANNRALELLGRKSDDVFDEDATKVALALRATNGTCTPLAFDESVFVAASDALGRHSTASPETLLYRSRMLRDAYRVNPVGGKVAYERALVDARAQLRDLANKPHVEAMRAQGYSETFIDQVLALNLDLQPTDYAVINAPRLRQLVTVLERCGDEFWVHAKGRFIKTILSHPQSPILIAAAEALVTDRANQGSILVGSKLLRNLVLVEDASAFAASIPALATLDDQTWDLALGFVADGVNGALAAEAAPLLKKSDSDVAYRLPNVAQMAHFESGAQLVEAVHFIIKLGVGMTVQELIVSAVKDWGVICSPSDFTTKRVGALLARVAERLPNEQSHLLPIIVHTIDTIHDEDSTGKDVVRKTFVSTLDQKGIFAAMGVADLHTSTYLMLRERLMSEGPLGVRLDALDPLHTRQLPFLRSLGRFRDVELYDQVQNRLLETALGLLRDADDAILMLPLLETHMPGSERVETSLCDAIIAAAGGETPAPAAYLLRVFFERGLLRSERALAMAALLPPLPNSAPPLEAWRKDRVIWAQLFYYPDERAFDVTRDFLVEDHEFKEKESKRENDDKSVTLERKAGGFTQRVTLMQTTDPKGPISALESNEVDIVAHRGHSYHLDQTFPFETLNLPASKLIYGGSCNGYSMMSSQFFMSYYGGVHLAADADRGEGAVNDALLISILNGATDPSASSWADLFPARYLAKGVVPPNDPAMLIARYMSLLAAE